MEKQTYKPISNLIGSIGKQREISARNADDLCMWVYRWGWTTAQIINRSLDLKRPGLADEFVKKGLLEKLESDGRGEKFVYILSSDGARRAELLLDDYHDMIKIYPYTLTESRKVPFSLHNHNMVCQHVVLDILGPRPNPMSYISELEYRNDGGFGDGVPDFGVNYGDNFLICEVELNQKEESRMKRWIWLRVMELRHNPRNKIVFFTPLKAVREGIKKILDQDRIYEFEKNRNNHWIEATSILQSVKMIDYRDRIEIRELEKDVWRKTGGLFYPSKYNTDDDDIMGMGDE